MRIQALRGAEWQAGTPTERIVLAVDLYDSTRRRIESVRDAPDPAQHIALYAGSFLRHNAIVHELYEELDPGIDAELVDFVSDGVLFTLAADCSQQAMDFALRIVETLAGEKLDTSIGIDFGTIAAFTLLDTQKNTTRFLQVVGKPVDRAVRLSWIARPGEVLVTSLAANSQSLHDVFEFTPHGAALEVSLDKWHRDGPTELAVHAVSRLGQPTNSFQGNTRKLYRYTLELREAIEEFVGFDLKFWATAEDMLFSGDSWQQRRATGTLLELLTKVEAPLLARPPEVAVNEKLSRTIDEFTEWCSTTRRRIQEFNKGQLAIGEDSWQSDKDSSNRECIEKFCDDVRLAAGITLSNIRGVQDAK